MILFKDMNPDSRVWIYQADKSFENSVEEVRKILDEFVNQWSAHRNDLLAQFDIVYNQFIFLAVDEDQAAASGCSIDSSVKVIQEIENKFNISLLNRMLLSYRENDEIKVISRSDFAKNYRLGLFNNDLIVFNNTLNFVKELNKWEVPASESWHSEAFG